MADEMTVDERVAELEALMAAATEGPWEYDDTHGALFSESFGADNGCLSEPMSPADMRFVAAARNHLPALLSALRDERQARERAEGGCAAWANHNAVPCYQILDKFHTNFLGFRCKCCDGEGKTRESIAHAEDCITKAGQPLLGELRAWREVAVSIDKARRWHQQLLTEEDHDDDAEETARMDLDASLDLLGKMTDPAWTAGYLDRVKAANQELARLRGVERAAKRALSEWKCGRNVPLSFAVDLEHAVYSQQAPATPDAASQATAACDQCGRVRPLSELKNTDTILLCRDGACVPRDAADTQAAQGAE